MKSTYVWGLFLFLVLVSITSFFVLPELIEARNVRNFSDTISDSRPNNNANHTFRFTIGTDIAAGGHLNFTWPAEFTVLSTSTFSAARNVELLVNGSRRNVGTDLTPTQDQAIITTGAGGSVRYNLNSTTGLQAGDQLVFKVGNHTSAANIFSQSFSTTTGTSTTPADTPGIQNASTTGEHRIALSAGGASDTLEEEFLIFLIDAVGVGPINTFETVPPVRFNGAPAGEIGGTTLSVEISLNTDELAVCKYSSVPGVAYQDMPHTFENTGLIVHSEIITDLVNESTYNYYVRCIDDEDNFNIDDYLITFTVPEVPEGEPNTDGEVEGNGTGSGDEGDGSEDSSGGSDTGSDGDGTEGGSDTSGSSGGGGSGGTSSGSGSQDAGGFSTGQPYESGDARVVVNGYAFPNSTVVLLVDGGIAEEDRAGSDGSFSVTIDAIARGSYTFGVYAIDENDVKSSTFSTTFSVSGARTSNLSNINVMPSIVVKPDPVDPGEPLTISGYSIPNARITIENQKDGSKASLKTLFADANAKGEWSVDVDTARFSQGTYKVRASAEQTGGISTKFSNYTFYGVGQSADVPVTSDLNSDGKVNLTDFSILLFWWGSDGGESLADINNDGSVSLTDFSIMLFNWSG